MSSEDRWLLPEGIEEWLPERAERLEGLRARLLKLYHSWGYDLVVPPLIEHLESLLVGVGHEMEAQTFKLVDQLSGRLMGVRADMTPQVARIDAHRIKQDAPNRLCYFGPVLLSKARELAGSRSPIQAGVELYGHEGVESDLEIASLMAASLSALGVESFFLDIGHVGVFGGLSRAAGLSAEQENRLFDALQRKAKPEIAELVAELADKKMADMLLALADLNGGVEVLAQARECLAAGGDEVAVALDRLQQFIDRLQQVCADVPLHIDLAELRGFRYHTGLVFAAYAPGVGQAVARGGRYDGIGEVFGRYRPATGYSLELDAVLSLTSLKGENVSAISAPAQEDAALRREVQRLRNEGERVICELPGQEGGMQEQKCDRVLVQRDGQWVIEQL